jgi:hypothetical protein
VRRETSINFRNKNKEYLKHKIVELETNSQVKFIRNLYMDINGFKEGYQPRTNMVQDEKCDLVADCHSILARWRNHFSQLNMYMGLMISSRETEIHTARLLEHEPSAFDFAMAIDKLKRHKSPGIDQIPTELIKAGGRTIRYEIYKHFISVWNKEELPEE